MPTLTRQHQKSGQGNYTHQRPGAFLPGIVEATATINFTLLTRMASKAISMDRRAEALHGFFRNSYNQETFGCLPSANRNLDRPFEDSNSVLIHPAVLLMKPSDKASVTLGDGERRTNISCKMLLCTSSSSRRSLNIALNLEIVHTSVRMVQTMLRTWD